MDKKWVEQTLEGLKVCFDYPADYEPSIVPEAWIENVGQVTNLIVGQHEQELSQLQAQEVIDLQAQVMVSGFRELVACETLRYIKDFWWDKHYPEDVFVGGPDSDDGVNELVAIREMINNALSAAPKVAWRGPAVVGRAQLLAWDHTVLRRDSTLRPLSKHVGTSPGVILGEEVGTDGELVDLIALECPPKGEQPTESEQGATDD